MTLDKTPETIQTMFNMISEKYDFMNNIISFGMQYFIKKNCIKQLVINLNSNVLDLCCGTGDLAKLLKRYNPNSSVTGMDFSVKMIEIAKNRIEGVRFLQGDATNLPYADNTFDAVTMGFGLRNIQNAEKTIEEVYRVLKPNGKFLHLDFGEKNVLSSIYDKVIMFIVRIFSNDIFAYKYLIDSKKMFPIPEELIKIFEKRGLKLLKRKDYLFKTISCQIYEK